MINIFNIKKNDRYIYNDKVIVIEDVSIFGTSWYYIREWIDSGQTQVNLHRSSKIELLFKARNI